MKIEHKDYFGNLIEVGDDVIMALYSELKKETVGKITPSAIFLNSTKRVNVAKPGKSADWQTVPHLLRKEARYFAKNMIVLTKM